MNKTITLCDTCNEIIIGDIIEITFRVQSKNGASLYFGKPYDKNKFPIGNPDTNYLGTKDFCSLKCFRKLYAD